MNAFLNFLENTAPFCRMQIKQTEQEERETMEAWNALTPELQKYYIPPDGYREETDAEFRIRIQAKIKDGE